MVMEDTQVRGIELVIWQHICQPSQQSNGNINTSQEHFVYLGSNWFTLCGLPTASWAGPPISAQPISLSTTRHFALQANPAAVKALEPNKTHVSCSPPFLIMKTNNTGIFRNLCTWLVNNKLLNTRKEMVVA